jgi:hypothetical protein
LRLPLRVLWRHTTKLYPGKLIVFFVKQSFLKSSEINVIIFFFRCEIWYCLHFRGTWDSRILSRPTWRLICSRRFHTHHEY